MSPSPGSRCNKARSTRPTSPTPVSRWRIWRSCGFRTRAPRREPPSSSRARAGFDLVILDLGPEAIRDKLRNLNPKRRYPSRLSTPLLTKLVGLARKHATAVVVLTEKTGRASSVSLSHLVTRRGQAEQRRSLRAGSGNLERQEAGTGTSPSRGVSCTGWPALTSPPSRFNFS